MDLTNQITCEHNFSGDTVYTSESGKKIYWHTYRQWSSYTEQARGEFIIQHHEAIADPIVQISVCCKHCKLEFHPPIYHGYESDVDTTDR